MREGDCPSEIFRLQTGWCARVKILADGSRQILSFVLPGDVLSLELRDDQPFVYSVVAMTDVVVCALSKRKVAEEMKTNAHLRAVSAEWWARKVAVLEQTVTTLGRMSAAGRIAHLILHFYLRLRERGLASSYEFEVPLRHEDLADALGITPPHLSRTLATMREEGILEIGHGKVSIKDFDSLTALCK